MKKIKYTQKNVERAIYILLIIVLVFYGLKNSEAAVALITAVKEAFSILIQ
ncbi:MAG: hypothetical protein LBC40_00395 [Dysgonamonadaceae bacterium]|jgi:hypothetical protein|nr:hypothetical protein [Dysgonamonadaceae bacterium]